MELHGTPARFGAVGVVGLAVSGVIGLLDDPLGVLERSGLWAIAWYVSTLAMVGGLGLGALLQARQNNRREAR